MAKVVRPVHLRSDAEPAALSFLDPGASVNKRWKFRRNAVIAVAHFHGITQRALADVFDLPRSRIAVIIKDLSEPGDTRPVQWGIADGLRPPPPPPRASVSKRWRCRRNAVIYVAYRNGFSQRALADVFDLPRSRIGAVVKELSGLCHAPKNERSGESPSCPVGPASGPRRLSGSEH